MSEINEDLRKWFREKWVRFDTKGNIKGDCAREPGEGKPKCLPQSKAHALGKKKRASAARRKRREDPHAGRKGKAKFVKTHNEETINEIRDVVKAAIIHGRQLTRGAKTLANNPKLTTAQKIRFAVTHGGMKGQEAAEKIWDYPYNVTTPTSGALYTAAGTLGSSALNIAKITARLKRRKRKMKNEETLLEKNVPTNPKLWAQAKAQAKKKFKIYPSAYANGWASKWYKSKGGGWKTLNEDYEHEMARNELRTAMRGIERLMKHLDGEGDLEAWVQSKLTKASDYIDTLADYMDSRDKTVKEAYELISEAKKKMDKRTLPQTVQMQTPGSNPYADDSTCPSYVSTPGQPITEAKGPKTAIGFKRAAQNAVAAGATGKKRKVAKEIARQAQEVLKQREAERAAKKAATEAAKVPLYAGQKKMKTSADSPKPKSENLSPAMKPKPTESPKGDTPTKRIADAFGRPGYESKKKTPMLPPNPKPISTEPQTFEEYLHHIGETGKRISRRKAKEFIHRDYTKLMAAALGTDHPALKAHAIEVAKQYKKASIRTYRELAGGPIHRVLKALRLREEHGAGNTGTTELTKYIERTPGQLPLDGKKKKLSIIKDVVKEEVLNEYTKLATSAGHGTGVTITKPRSGSPAGRLRRTGKKLRRTTTIGRSSARPAKPKNRRPRENPIYARRASISSLRKAQSGARKMKGKIRASERIAVQQARARLR
jgi:hypothetical protein